MNPYNSSVLMICGASMYLKNTLFGGDHTGSHYFDVMENPAIASGTIICNENDYSAFSGRLNPGCSEELHTAMGNLFRKYKSLEFFRTAESAKGHAITAFNERKETPYAADLIYRFLRGKENFWVGFRYNTVTALLQGFTSNITVNGEAWSIGWFITKKIVAKAEYVNQDCQRYPSSNTLNGGNFHGAVLEASGC